MASETSRSSIQKIGLVLGLVFSLLLVLFFDGDPDKPQVALMAAIVVLMAIWWLCEAVPLAATALIPVVAFPVAGIMDGKAVAKAYVNQIMFLFIGGFLIALAIERWNLHRRIALNIIYFMGRRADMMIMGFMAAAAFLSMWISNTATAAMMLPIGLAIVAKLEDSFGRERTRRFSVALMLAIAYSCSIGGVATLVGTPTNLAFASIFQETFPEAPEVTFGQWMAFGLPYAFVMFFVIWFLLTRVFCRVDKDLVLDRSGIRRELDGLGAMGYEEKAVSVVFAMTAVLWIFRRDLNLGAFTIPGWTGIWEPLKAVNDGTVAVAMALILFVIPAGRDKDSRGILDGGAFGRLPWGIILLFSGGFALAAGFGASGLSAYLGNLFGQMGDIHLILILAIVCLGVTFLTELTSNVATASMLLPVLAAWAVAREVNPLFLMVPATISASMAFMMPVATPPNAIVFGSQRIRIIEMARVGIALNFVAVVFTLLVSYLLLGLVFGIEPGQLPDWAGE